MSKILFRQARMLDLNKMKALNEKSLKENYDYDYWKIKWNKNKEHCFVAMNGNDVVGYIFADENTLISVAIDEKYRNKKIGSELLKHVLNSYCMMQNEIKLHVRPSNDPGKKLYTNYGFVENIILKDYYKEPVEDAIEMIYIPNAILFKTVDKIKINM